MKRLTTTLALLGGLSFSALAADDVDVTQLPEAVRKTLNASKGVDAIKDIEKQTRDGRTVYEVEFDRRGFNPKLVIAEDGTVVRDSRRDAAATARTADADRHTGDYVPLFPRTATLQLNEVPQAVQNTIQQHAAGRQIADIDRETWNNRTVYEVEFAQSGRNAQIHVAEDGTVVKEETRTGLPSLREATGTAPGSTTGAGTGRGLFGIYLGTQLEDTPAAVQETIRREAKGHQIADIDREMRTGSPVYEVEIRQPGGNYELHIADNGSILRDSRQRDAVGTAERLPQSGTGRGWDRVGQNLNVNDLPPAVRNQINARGGAAAVKQINSKVVYEVELEQQGKNSKLHITEDGTVVESNR